MTPTPDTIVAVATPTGRAGIGVIRISGSLIPNIAASIIGSLPSPRYAKFCTFKSLAGEIIDQGIALYFPNPHSFTGEDLLEIHGHGNPIVMDLIVQEIIKLGARLARPGEFTQRAFLNDKIDLAQAEAVADLINSSTEAAARNALKSLQGDFSVQVEKIKYQLIGLRTYVEASLDFSDEDIDFLQAEDLKRQFVLCNDALVHLLKQTHQGIVLRDAVNIVILGQPNVGKSSLLNRLAQTERAIVTDIPGTTRDIIQVDLTLDGLLAQLADTAGLRASQDIIEQEGIRRSLSAATTADIALYVVQADLGISSEDQQNISNIPASCKIIVVHNKSDLLATTPLVDELCNFPQVFVSAKSGLGIPKLLQQIKNTMGLSETSDGAFSARRRHLTALQKTEEYLCAAQQELETTQAGELIAEQLRLAHQVLGEITGEFTSDDLLGEIFASFCIGK